MKSYITCPVCGTKFGKAEEVKDLDLQCPRCRENLIVNVTSVGVAIHKADALKKDAPMLKWRNGHGDLLEATWYYG